MRKPRSDAKLLNLPEEQQSQLAEWLLGGMPYHAAQATVEKEFGVRVSLGAFTQFWVEVCTPQLLRRRSEAAQAADEIAAEAGRRPGAFDQATIEALRQKAFELAISPRSAPNDVRALFVLLQKARDQDLEQRKTDLAERRLVMLEARLQAVQSAVTEARSGGLTEEALAKIEQAARLL